MGSFEQLKNTFKSLVQSQQESASNSLGMAESFQKVQNLSDSKLNQKVISKPFVESADAAQESAKQISEELITPIRETTAMLQAT